MDPRRRGSSDSFNGVQLGSQPLPILSHPTVVAGSRFDSNTFLDNSYRNFSCPQPGLAANSVSSYSSVSPEDDSAEDCDFSDVVLKYINQMLMEEDMEDKTCMLKESLELQAAEKSFYEVLGKKYPPSPELFHRYASQYGEIPAESSSGTWSNYITSSCNSGGYFGDTTSIQSPDGYSSQLQGLPSYRISQSFNGYGLVDSPNSSIYSPDWNTESQSVWQFNKGVEEASRFLPGETNLVVELEANEMSVHTPKVGAAGSYVKVERTDEGEYSSGGSRGKKNLYRVDEDVEEKRSSKQAAFSSESPLRSEMFDVVLLCSTGEGQERLESLREALQNGMSKSVIQNGQSEGSNGGKGRGKKQSVKKEVVDLRTLLISCAQAVAADDHRTANELLKKVRQHSSPFGDGTQRLAHCFANGLEARLAGTGSQIYKGLVSKRTSAADILKAYHLYLAASPFKKMSNFVSNVTIMNLAEKSTRLHVIDFGILYGFQWPTLIQRISWREGGPPKVRITGIEFPQPGFRPAERVEETGRRLAAYAEKFNVPFEYNAIAKKWETITLEELKIDKDEVLVVNFLYRGKNLLDESVSVDSVRNRVLDLIRRINPDIFIHGVVNGAYNAPFFVTRFREALFHFSLLFDMLETVVPREDQERMLIEKEIFGREALNVIACEGWERVERPETYKQWHVRNLRAGFVQIPFDRELVKAAAKKVSSLYHKDFVIDEDSRWLLQGWKGRTAFALSAWKPA
ncbi:scarecrow-like protein 9 [Pyrus ussuriensis x Pyrus communis]|uniref:Scarecrow-like protein 9 n=1 Tax=Pyrus ussuriensis x Pyrus communis TaxID=2448454 RepID=A0A5N5H7M1_9ROSA|nr:scarecrow-like protein 9 [Pyrus ussuriensis x Pyrus communis]